MNAALTLPQNLDLAVIGNSHVAALVDKSGRFVWACWPRMDADPVFCALLDGDTPQAGFFSIECEEESTSQQEYLRNTALVRTDITTASGAAFSITDFAPRFRQHDRTYRPAMFIRRIEPLSGICRIRIKLRPKQNYGKVSAKPMEGSNHISYGDGDSAFRITTDAPIAYLLEEKAFILSQPLTIILHKDETLSENITQLAAEFQQKTQHYWQHWVRNLSLPFEWQEAVIRSAITLQLCSFHQTGAIVAALTTSVPESAGSSRNWDYRFCWIRDAYFTVQALNRVGATRTMERFIEYIKNIVCLDQSGIQPLYAIVPGTDLKEEHAEYLKGYRGHAPVRIGNAAALQIQHDVYGSIILAAMQMFFDERLPVKADKGLFDLLEPLGEKARHAALTPDAGIWEYRHRQRIHTYSAVMCWVACDRLARIALQLQLHDKATYWMQIAAGLKVIILERAWSKTLNCFSGSLDYDEVDASTLLMHELGIIAADDPRFIASVNQIGTTLMRNGMLLRYAAPDDFGLPETAFTICTFWYVDALEAIGRREEARHLFESILKKRNHVGLLSEDIDLVTGELWGNFPQTYSMVGIIESAIRLSKH